MPNPIAGAEIHLSAPAFFIYPMKIEENSVWLYVGPAPGKNMEHKVVMRTKNDVTTWSCFDKDPNNGGYSWTGTDTEFLLNFQPSQKV